MKDPRKELKVKEASQMSHIVSVVTDQIHEMKAVPTEVSTDLDDDAKGQDPNVILKKNLSSWWPCSSRADSSAALTGRFSFVR